MKNNIHLVIAILAILVMSAAPAALARGGGGNGVPSPFVASSNHKVELADGEMYTLQGKVIVDSNSGDLYFNVDLRKHPWLANARRVRNPYYPIEGDMAQWQPYEGKSILLVAVAHIVVGGGTYEIVLQPVNENPARSIVIDR